MSSALGLPLQRIDQSRSNDLGSVSAYYSRELVTYVRKVWVNLLLFVYCFLFVVCCLGSTDYSRDNVLNIAYDS